MIYFYTTCFFAQGLNEVNSNYPWFWGNVNYYLFFFVVFLILSLFVWDLNRLSFKTWFKQFCLCLLKQNWLPIPVNAYRRTWHLIFNHIRTITIARIRVSITESITLIALGSFTGVRGLILVNLTVHVAETVGLWVVDQVQVTNIRTQIT